ncbi:MAG: GNAT family N-acetyltransferase [Paracoccaceae bacterium]
MSGITVRIEDPRNPAAVKLLQSSHSLMQTLFPDDSCHYLSIEELCDASVSFFVAWQGSTAAGCGALAVKDGYGEVKSMFTADSSRGQGIADLIMDRIEQSARADGLPLLRLETGDTLGAAHRLYQRHGFEFRGPFGDYSEHPQSMFMEKSL